MPAIPPPDTTTDFALGPGRDILVVDDSAANLVAVEAALAPLGRPLVFARSGIEALARLLDQDFDLILLDVAMPEMDGFETARMILARERNRETPILFITGLPCEPDLVLRGYELGACDFLIKPISPQILRAKAKVFLGLQARMTELRDRAS
jgi:CheY-like chemotaxis protein